jgi:hypothetical protein
LASHGSVNLAQHKSNVRYDVVTRNMARKAWEIVGTLRRPIAPEPIRLPFSLYEVETNSAETRG